MVCMAPIRKLSRQTARLLGALLSDPSRWRYGYDLTKELGLQSGTLYPLLIRLTEQGLLESEWQPATRPGRPPRHAYRLTHAGISFAHANGATGEQQAATGGTATA